MKLPRPKVGRALTESEEDLLFRMASSRPKWKVAYLCSLLTVNTTCGPKEIRMLRLMDLNLSPVECAPHGTIRIMLGAKNEYRQRMIPLNMTASLAITQLIARARGCGAVQPEHYLLGNYIHESLTLSEQSD